MTTDDAPGTKAAAPARSRGGWRSLVLIALVVVGFSQLANWWRDERAARLIPQNVSPTDITLYTTSTCPYCAKARAWLTRHDVPWRECNVETDEACMKIYESRGAPGVPLIQAKGRWHLGFDPAWLGDALQAPAAVDDVRPRLSPNSYSSPKRDNSPRP